MPKTLLLLISLSALALSACGTRPDTPSRLVFPEIPVREELRAPCQSLALPVTLAPYTSLEPDAELRAQIEREARDAQIAERRFWGMREPAHAEIQSNLCRQRDELLGIIDAARAWRGVATPSE